jgi:mono/diheme cytochrome c family protein
VSEQKTIMLKTSYRCAALAGVVLGGMMSFQLLAAGPNGRGIPLAGTRLEQSPQVAVSGGAANHRAVLDKYCVTCHNTRLKTANLTLDTLSLDQIGEHAEIWEKVAQKLRARTMPPPQRPRPDEATYEALAAWLEGGLDRAAAARPNPGAPTLHRLNRVEYSNAVRDLLKLEIDGAAMLPPDEYGYGFDNIGDVLSVSPLLMERYMSAARTISRLAVGDPSYSPYVDTYTFSKDLWQDRRMSEDLPFGSRGGRAIRRYFSLDGEYVLRIRLQRSHNDRGIRGISREETIEVRLDSDLVKSFSIGKTFANDPKYDFYHPQGDAAIARHNYEESADDALVVTFPVKAGMHTVGVSFVDSSAAVYEGIGPELFPVRSFSNLNDDTNLMQVDSIMVGPAVPAGAEDTPSRRQIFVCQPKGGAEEACARTILSRLARRAYRRSPTSGEIETLLGFYRAQTARGFDAAIGSGIRRLLVSPEFLFRLESDPSGSKPGQVHRLSDLELASRLSFFLWSSIPDDELIDAAERGRLKDPKVLEQQVRRMLADSRASELMRNFGGQWLLLRNVKFATPDADIYPEWDDNLREALQREAELFLESIWRGDRSIVDLVDADYSFLNERLARHYGIRNVYGQQFRRVALPDARRGGLLGMGAIQLVTSQATRTSPVLRGKWVLENLLGTPPPAPPPNVPPFPDSGDMTKLSVRARMEMHRKNPVCASCHQSMDPLGFALENFDGIGMWRTTDSGQAIDASGTLPDGKAFSGPGELRKLLLNHQDQFVQTLTRKLMTYALGRGVEYSDGPAVRRIARDAAPDYRWSSIVLGIVKSVPFQQRIAVGSQAEETPVQRLN